MLTFGLLGYCSGPSNKSFAQIYDQTTNTPRLWRILNDACLINILFFLASQSCDFTSLSLRASAGRRGPFRKWTAESISLSFTIKPEWPSFLHLHDCWCSFLMPCSSWQPASQGWSQMETQHGKKADLVANWHQHYKAHHRFSLVQHQVARINPENLILLASKKCTRRISLIF